MAFTIKIYEKDNYIYSLLKKRLSSFYPDAYIVNPYIDGSGIEDRFSNYTCVLYDPSDTDFAGSDDGAYISLRQTEDSRIIECARIISLLNSEEGFKVTPKPATGSVYAVLPFVYSGVRNRFISDLSTGLSGADNNIRLDFTNKLRSLWRGSTGNNMTSLLEACKSRKFRPEDILKYCNMDDLGFLTPGGTTSYDDVYDYGIERSISLMNHAASLAHSNLGFTNVIAVIEGFKTKDLPELLSCCDKVSILLPAKADYEDPGSQELISMLTKALGRERVSVYYSEDIDVDESLTPRRLVV